MHTGAHRDQKSVSDPLELGLETIVTYPTRVLRAELRSLARASTTLNSCGISSDYYIYY